MPVFNRFYQASGVQPHAALAATGPIFPVEIGVPPTLAQLLTKQGEPVPPPVAGMALFDTGASVTCVDDSVIQSLGVQPVGQGRVHTPSGTATQAIYPAQFRFPSMDFNVTFDSVFGAHLAVQGIIALIGRDVLSSAVMVYNGPGGLVTLCF